MGPTECPGTNLYALLPAIRDSVENNLQRVGYIAKVPSVTTSTTSSETTKTIITRPSLPLAANSQKTILALPPIVANPARVYMLHARTANM